MSLMHARISVCLTYSLFCARSSLTPYSRFISSTPAAHPASSFALPYSSTPLPSLRVSCCVALSMTNGPSSLLVVYCSVGGSRLPCAWNGLVATRYIVCVSCFLPPRVLLVLYIVKPGHSRLPSSRRRSCDGAQAAFGMAVEKTARCRMYSRGRREAGYT